MYFLISTSIISVGSIIIAVCLLMAGVINLPEKKLGADPSHFEIVYDEVCSWVSEHSSVYHKPSRTQQALKNMSKKEAMEKQEMEKKEAIEEASRDMNQYLEWITGVLQVPDRDWYTTFDLSFYKFQALMTRHPALKKVWMAAELPGYSMQPMLQPTHTYLNDECSLYSIEEESTVTINPSTFSEDYVRKVYSDGIFHQGDQFAHREWVHLTGISKAIKGLLLLI